MILSRLKLAHKGIILVSMPLLSGIVFTVMLASLLQQSQQDLSSELKAKETIALINNLSTHMVDAAGARATLQINKKGDAEGPQYWFDACRLDLAKLKKLVRSDSSQMKKVAQLENLIESGRRDFEQLMSIHENPTTLSELVSIDQLAPIDSLITRLNDLCESILVPVNLIEKEGPQLRASNRQHIQQLLLAAVCLNVLLTVSLAVYFSRSIAGRLKKVSADTVLLSTRQPLTDIMEGSDEIALLDRAFHAAARDLERLETMRKGLVAAVSHELRSPLTAIQSIFYLAGQGAFGPLTPAAEKSVLASENEAGQLILIINDLLDLEKLEAGKVDMVLESVSLEDIVADALNAARVIAERQEVTIESSCASTLVRGDRSWLTRAVENLIVNAVMRSARGSRVNVTGSQSEDDAGMVELRIEDEAAGSIEVSQEELFSRFSQVAPGENLTGDGCPAAVRESNDSVRIGSGLGLPIARVLVELHNGSIALSRKAGSGNVFRVRFPVCLATEEVPKNHA
jgi:signal transduction histidine kinase